MQHLLSRREIPEKCLDFIMISFLSVLVSPGAPKPELTLLPPAGDPAIPNIPPPPLGVPAPACPIQLMLPAGGGGGPALTGLVNGPYGQQMQCVQLVYQETSYIPQTTTGYLGNNQELFFE